MSAYEDAVVKKVRAALASLALDYQTNVNPGQRHPTVLIAVVKTKWQALVKTTARPWHIIHLEQHASARAAVPRAVRQWIASACGIAAATLSVIRHRHRSSLPLHRVATAFEAALAWHWTRAAERYRLEPQTRAMHCLYRRELGSHQGRDKGVCTRRRGLTRLQTTTKCAFVVL